MLLGTVGDHLECAEPSQESIEMFNANSNQMHSVPSPLKHQPDHESIKNDSQDEKLDKSNSTIFYDSNGNKWEGDYQNEMQKFEEHPNFNGKSRNSPFRRFRRNSQFSRSPSSKVTARNRIQPKSVIVSILIY